MKYIILFLISFVSFSFEIKQKNVDVYELSTFFDLLSKTLISKSDATKIIKDLIQILERYVFLDIAKNPPKDLPKVDLINELKKIMPTENEIKLYKFYSDIKTIIDNCHDRHLDININRHFINNINIKNCFFIFPMYFIIKNKKIYGYPNLEYKDYFSQEIIQTIESHKNIPISEINYQSPIEYIQNFNGDFRKYKSKQAQFIQNQHTIPKVNVSCFPFISTKNLSSISLSYSNSDFKIFDYKVIHYTDDSYQINPHVPFLFEDPTYDESKGIQWDKSVEDEGGLLRCRIDSDNEVNVIYQNSFHINIDKAVTFFDECFSSFDENNYPLIIIENYNPGGYVHLADNLFNYVNLNSPSPFPTAFRYNNDVKENISEFYSGRDLETCKKQDKSIFDSGPVEKDGHKRTKTFDTSDISRKKFKNFRKKAKNIRIPTEIIIFTDGFSYSATSIFIKETQLRGGAIIVGFGGNPEIEQFDSSLAPSPVTTTDELYATNRDKISKEILDLGFTLKYPIQEIFGFNSIRYKDYPIEIDDPLEYREKHIDERIEIYNDYNDSKYKDFIRQAKIIFHKYEYKCNYDRNNWELLKIDKNCKFDGDKHLHGGYECGMNGYWDMSKCIPSYCDNDYIFDSNSKKCVKDPCSASLIASKILLLTIGIYLIFT